MRDNGGRKRAAEGEDAEGQKKLKTGGSRADHVGPPPDGYVCKVCNAPGVSHPVTSHSVTAALTRSTGSKTARANQHATLSLRLATNATFAIL